MDNYFTSFRLFVCLPSLELIIFEQEVCSTKIGYANTLSSGRNSCKKNKKRGHLEQRSARQAKTLCNLYGWLEWHQGALHRFFWILPIYQKFVRRWKKVGRKYIQEQQPKSIPLLQPEHGFCQKNVSGLGQTQDWYLNEKIVVVAVCLNGRCCSAGCVGIVFIERQIIPEQYRNLQYPIRRLLWWHKLLLEAFWMQEYSKHIQASKMECFCANS